MKKFIAVVLSLVMIFSFAVPSFSYPESDTEMEALNEIEYWTYWIFQDFTGYFLTSHEWLSSIWQVITNSIAANVDLMETDVDSLAQNMLTLVSRSESSLSNLLDINEYLRSVNTELTSLNDNLFGNMNFLFPLAQVIQSDLGIIKNKFTDTNGYLAELVEVLADENDIALKESQKENQQFVQDTFFNPGSDLSLNLDKLGDFTGYVESFKTSFDFSSVGTESPLDMVGEGSDFSKWFSEDTALSIDPTYGGGSGGGGGETPDPDEPDPDEPDPDEPDPDEPDPPTPTIKNWLPLATSEPGGSEIFNNVGYLEGYYFSGGSNSVVAAAARGVTGYIPCSPGDTIYFYGFSPYSNIYFFDSSVTGTLYPQSGQWYHEDNYSYLIVPNNVNYFRLNFVLAGTTLSSAVISINQIPIQTASTFSLRAQPVPFEPEIVTSAYADRMNEFYKLLGGDN